MLLFLQYKGFKNDIFVLFIHWIANQNENIIFVDKIQFFDKHSLDLVWEIFETLKKFLMDNIDFKTLRDI